MADFKERIDELAQLMEEFHLSEARLEHEGTTIAFRRRATARPTQAGEIQDDSDHAEYFAETSAPPQEERQSGTPVGSPMTGIFYGSPSPNSPAFVKVGDVVSAGQIIGLIEAMKVFSEIPCTASGTVLKLGAESGQVVQPGDPLLWVG